MSKELALIERRGESELVNEFKRGDKLEEEMRAQEKSLIDEQTRQSELACQLASLDANLREIRRHDLESNARVQLNAYSNVISNLILYTLSNLSFLNFNTLISGSDEIQENRDRVERNFEKVRSRLIETNTRVLNDEIGCENERVRVGKLMVEKMMSRVRRRLKLSRDNEHQLDDRIRRETSRLGAKLAEIESLRQRCEMIRSDGEAMRRRRVREKREILSRVGKRRGEASWLRYEIGQLEESLRSERANVSCLRDRFAESERVLMSVEEEKSEWMKLAKRRREKRRGVDR